MSNEHTIQATIKKVISGKIIEATDELAAEEPLEIRLQWNEDGTQMQQNISVTMRTPGNDAELAAGFLFTEAVIDSFGDIKQILQSPQDSHAVIVQLSDTIRPQLQQTERNFFAASGCGVCGKSGIDKITTTTKFPAHENRMEVDAGILYGLEEMLLAQQAVFKHTGGLHAAALFDAKGKFMMLREDIGRHNALDKLIGACLMDHGLPLANHILLLSGRAGFELIQKAAMAGIPVIAAIGAPSGLAVETALASGITLVGFLRSRRFNVYTGSNRIIVQ